MPYSATALIWPPILRKSSLPKTDDNTSRADVLSRKPVRNTSYSVQPASQPSISIDLPAKDLRFGAFRTFDENVERAKALAMMHHPEQFKLLPLNTAADLWLEEKKLYIKKPRTVEAYALYIRNLKKHLGEIPLCSLHIGHFSTYQQTRMAMKIRKDKAPCPSYVNHELNTLAQILKRADMWDLIEKHYKPLPVGNWTPPKVLSVEDEERFFRIAASNPDWKVAYWACSITTNTSAYGTELRNLRLKDVFLDHNPPKFHVPDDKVKNEFRARVIPLNETAEAHMRLVIERADSKGAKRPEHCIFPKRIKRNEWDVTQPGSPSFIRHGFREMRDAMGEGFEWLTPRNFRNQLITKLFEGGEPDETITSIAGHTNIKMSKYYSRIRIDRKMEALSALVPKKKPVEKSPPSSRDAESKGGYHA